MGNMGGGTNADIILVINVNKRQLGPVKWSLNYFTLESCLCITNGFRHKGCEIGSGYA